jgi:hypothetical protein
MTREIANQCINISRLNREGSVVGLYSSLDEIVVGEESAIVDIGVLWATHGTKKQWFVW